MARRSVILGADVYGSEVTAAIGVGRISVGSAFSLVMYGALVTAASRQKTTARALKARLTEEIRVESITEAN